MDDEIYVDGSLKIVALLSDVCCSEMLVFKLGYCLSVCLSLSKVYGCGLFVCASVHIVN